MTFVGMDPQRVRRIAEQLQQQGTRITTVSEDVQRVIDQSVGGWEGVDYQDFSGAWSGQHRLMLTSAAEGVGTMATSVLEDIAEQEIASGIMPGGPGSAFPPGAVPPGAVPPGGSGSDDGGDGDGGDGGDDDEGGPFDDTGNSSVNGGEKEKDPDSKRERDFGDEKGKPDEKDDKRGETEVELAGDEWSGAVGDVEGEKSGEAGGGEYELTGEAHLAGADASYSGSATKDGLTGAVGAGVTLLGASGAASWAKGRGEVGVTGEGYVLGAEASAEGSIGKKGVHAEAEAFAGGKVGGGVSGDYAGVGGGVEGDVRYGIGAGGHVDVGMKDGKFTIGGSGMLTFGLGAKVGVEVTIDPGEISDAFRDVVPDVDLPSADDIKDKAGDLAEKADPRNWGWPG
jgi:uncharacterized protein YukE